MRMSRTSKAIFCMLAILGCGTIVFAKGDQTGSLSGTITSTKGAPLPAATVLVVGTNYGTAADINGNYYLRDVGAGLHKLSFSYVGYQTKTVEVNIRPGIVSKLDIVLSVTGVQGKEVVVTAQRSGQQGAINQQLKSTTIVNVVAADRLQQNPDAKRCGSNRPTTGSVIDKVRRRRGRNRDTWTGSELQPNNA